MTEGEPSNLPRILNPQERVAAYSYAASDRYGFDPVTAEHLRSYGHVQSRIRQLRREFEGTTTSAVNFPSFTVGGEDHSIDITRDQFQGTVNMLSVVAFSIYLDALSKNEKTRAAAREVDVFVIDTLPRFDKP